MDKRNRPRDWWGDTPRHPEATRTTLRKLQGKVASFDFPESLTQEDWQELCCVVDWWKGDSLPLMSEMAAAMRLMALGRVLQSGGSIPEEASKWLGEALVNIAGGREPDVALGLWPGKGRPPKYRRIKKIAAVMHYLTSHGLTQDHAASVVAEDLPRYWIKGVFETRDVKQAHNDLKASRGIFEHLQSVETGFDDHEQVGYVRLSLAGKHYNTYYMEPWDQLLREEKDADFSP